MQTGSSKHTYRWQDNWSGVPDPGSPKVMDTHSHHGIVSSQSGTIIFFNQADPSVVTVDRNGGLVGTWPSDLAGAHGMTLVNDGGAEHLWMADATADSPKVVKTTMDGEVVIRLDAPPVPVYDDGVYRPTSVAVNEERHGGNGDVWVADGYGESYIHRFDKEGNYVASINGEEGMAGRLSGPHGIWVDTRGPEPELYIADRTNGRVVVCDMDGGHKKVFGEDFLTTPSGFAIDGEYMVVTELRGRLTIVDENDDLVTYLGENPGVEEIDDWPNIDRGLHEPGKFVAPHGMCTDAKGNIYVAEWLKGGRITRLEEITP